MNRRIRSILRLLSLPAISTLLTACSVAMPFRWPGLQHSTGAALTGANDKVLLVLTNPTVYPDRRAAFDDYTQRLLKSMQNQPRLIGYSARRQLLGNEAWTVSIWVDDAAMQAFVTSPEHRAAMKAGNPALKSARFRREWISSNELPLNWTRVLQILEDGNTAPAEVY
jgi:quinol monooxygenase YgiN